MGPSKIAGMLRWGGGLGAIAVLLFSSSLLSSSAEPSSAGEIDQSVLPPTSGVFLPDAKASLSHLYNTGDERVRDRVLFIEQEQGNSTVIADALAELGLRSLSGRDESLTRNFTLAVSLLEKSASLGNASAQHIMAFAYATGSWGLERNEAKALLFDYFAALGGDIGAMMSMGYRYFVGSGVPKKCDSALLYYEMAANAAIRDRERLGVPPLPEKERLSEVANKISSSVDDSDLVDYYEYSADNDDPKALYALGQIYYYGARGVKQDLSKAYEYLVASSQMGEVAADALLGTMYAKGYGVERDYLKAFKYFKKADEQGHHAGQNGLGYLLLNGFGVERDIERALQFFIKAKDQGNVEAMYNLGTIYMGTYDSRYADYIAAFQLFGSAVQSGHVLSLYKFAQMYMHGLGTMKSCPHAAHFLKRVAERGPWIRRFKENLKTLQQGDQEGALYGYAVLAEEGYEVAQDNAAWMYDRGLGYEGNDGGEKAVRLYKHAALQHNVEANIKIGDYYYYGKGNVPVDYEKASRYYAAAAKQDNAQAMFNLGYMYEHGIGVAQDFHLAKRYYDMAADSKAEAFVPVRLALFKLSLHRLFLQYRHRLPWLQGPAGGANDTKASSRSSSSSPLLPSPHETEGEGPTQWLGFHLESDSLLIALLTVVLGALLFYRSRHH